MGKRSESQFYVVELGVQLTGVFRSKNSISSEAEKEKEKRTFFDRLLKTDPIYKNKYTPTSIIDYLTSLTEISYVGINYLIQLNSFSKDSQQNCYT